MVHQLHELEDPGIFPVSFHPADMKPHDLHCDLGAFRNYSGVDESAFTEEELTEHIEKNHLKAFDSEAETTSVPMDLAKAEIPFSTRLALSRR